MLFQKVASILETHLEGLERGKERQHALNNLAHVEKKVSVSTALNMNVTYVLWLLIGLLFCESSSRRSLSRTCRLRLG